VTAAPAYFTVGLVNSVEHDQVKRVVQSAYLPLRVTVEQP
jgi:hypothetical protein